VVVHTGDTGDPADGPNLPHETMDTGWMIGAAEPAAMTVPRLYAS